MTPKEYVEFNDFKPLGIKEKKRGKSRLKIYNTNEPMPWTEVYTQISIGISMEDIALKYGHGRKIALWAIEDNIQYIPTIAEAFEGEKQQRKTMMAIESVNPEVHKTILETVNEHAPDTAKNVVLLSSALIKKATTIVNEKYCSSSDLINVAKAVQTMTDTVGLTERFSNGVNISAASVQVSGFEFVLDSKPIEADIIEKDDG